MDISRQTGMCPSNAPSTQLLKSICENDYGTVVKWAAWLILRPFDCIKHLTISGQDHSGVYIQFPNKSKKFQSNFRQVDVLHTPILIKTMKAKGEVSVCDILKICMCSTCVRPRWCTYQSVIWGEHILGVVSTAPALSTWKVVPNPSVTGLFGGTGLQTFGCKRSICVEHYLFFPSVLSHSSLGSGMSRLKTMPDALCVGKKKKSTKTHAYTHLLLLQPESLKPLSTCQKGPLSAKSTETKSLFSCLSQQSDAH